MAGTVPARPLNCLHIPLSEWAKMTDGERKARSQSGTPTVEVSAPATEGISNSTSPKATQPLKDIRHWNEDVDGIAGERLRNCIIFQLDVRKKDFWTKNMSVSHVRRNAKALDEETPPGWEPNPLFYTKKNLDGEEVTYIRDPKNTDEWSAIHARLLGAHGIVNRGILKLLAKKNCPKCGGRGGYIEEVPEGSGRFYHTPCDCCHENPFNGSRIIRCECGREIAVPPSHVNDIKCAKCGVLNRNPHPGPSISSSQA